ncbi:MarR family winged helix-turn-helix transcriptional regulator [Fulvivirga lutimaris]|uniref:MarR family winged helix-turn-helix transcriptional regulator n=1 Tax=Fulvivirga lutimaris TaxID=1819566 RepID=UPI0012BB4E8D|nr:MarR family winged helix-turn-helix transcriptional regulator [Fulvivirga lutimaris]MTI39425.1 MarR family transcriptional regulator [Fulvivirga lutimaris]
MKTPNFDRIDPTLCINAKIRKLHKLTDKIYQARIRPFGLKGSMLSILFIVGKNEGINQKNIADLLVLDQSTISRDLKRLIDKGWIQFAVADDPRMKLLSLTADGRALLENVAPVWEATHKEMEALLGAFSIQQLNNITAAVKEADLK